MKIKFTRCDECGNRLDVFDNCIAFDGSVFCDESCAISYCENLFNSAVIQESDCTEEDEDYRDDKDE